MIANTNTAIFNLQFRNDGELYKDTVPKKKRLAESNEKHASAMRKIDNRSIEYVELQLGDEGY